MELLLYPLLENALIAALKIVMRYFFCPWILSSYIGDVNSLDIQSKGFICTYILIILLGLVLSSVYFVSHIVLCCYLVYCLYYAYLCSRLKITIRHKHALYIGFSRMPGSIAKWFDTIGLMVQSSWKLFLAAQKMA